MLRAPSPPMLPVPSRLLRPSDAFALFGGLIGRSARERVAVALLARDGALLRAVAAADGDGGTASLPVAAILRDALLAGATGLIVAHNHPSGDLRPSAEDLRATRTLAGAAAALGVELVDHVLVAAGGCLSLRLLGLL